jgi:hypothetical protein
MRAAHDGGGVKLKATPLEVFIKTTAAAPPQVKKLRSLLDAFDDVKEEGEDDESVTRRLLEQLQHRNAPLLSADETARLIALMVRRGGGWNEVALF